MHKEGTKEIMAANDEKQGFEMKPWSQAQVLCLASFEADGSAALVIRQDARVWVLPAIGRDVAPLEPSALAACCILAPGSRALHSRSGGAYRVLHWGFTADAQQQPVVVYQSEEDGRVWVRASSAMFDGRFVSVPEEHAHA